MSHKIAQLEVFLTRQPQAGPGVYVARGAVVIGDVRIGERASIWYNAVARGDINCIQIGRFTNIQDNAVLHVADDYPCLIGDYVTVGHSAIVHACEVGNLSLIGMGAVILDGAVIGEECLIGAKALVTQRTKIPPRSLVLGAPAKVVRPLTPEERTDLRRSAEHYAANAGWCLQRGIGVGTIG